MTFGEPLHFDGRYDGVPLGRARREVTDEIMAGHPGADRPGAGADVYNEKPPEFSPGPDQADSRRVDAARSLADRPARR